MVISLRLGAFGWLAVFMGSTSMVAMGMPQTGAPKGSAKVFPAQESVASKTAAFGYLPMISHEAEAALDCKDLAGGAKIKGKRGAFKGVVVTAYSPKGHASVYIDFSDPWKNTMSGHVNAADYAKFPDLRQLKGREVLVTGTVSLYQGTHPEIVLKDPSQIRFLKPAPHRFRRPSPIPRP